MKRDGEKEIDICCGEEEREGEGREVSKEDELRMEVKRRCLVDKGHAFVRNLL